MLQAMLGLKPGVKKSVTLSLTCFYNLSQHRKHADTNEICKKNIEKS